MAFGRRKRAGKAIDFELAGKALAKTVHDGDLVNFRLLFSPFSPLREQSPEVLDSDKYAYLAPGEDLEQDSRYREILELVLDEAIWDHVLAELEADRPAQLPWQLVLTLADRAAQLGKYTSAAQAYEMLRVRRRMQDEFFAEADAALESEDIPRAVHGYRIATGLEYNYSAFPEPLPMVPDFQTRALVIHGEHPERPEDCVALQDTEAFLRTGLAYLMLSPGAATRLENRSIAVQTAFLKELITQQDPQWQEFAQRFREASKLKEEFRGRLEDLREEAGKSSRGLEDEIRDQLSGDPREIPAKLLGWTIENGEWWQYLKELAYRHPASALFISRIMIGEIETLIPMHRPGSPVAELLGLTSEATNS